MLRSVAQRSIVVAVVAVVALPLHSVAQDASQAAGQAAAATAESTPVPIVRKPAEWNLGEGRLAIEGYDPVAYFPEGGGKPQKGDPALTVERDGAVYRFATARNRDLFLKDPARYEPAFGGWCAYAMGREQGEKVEVDPESFLVTDGRLLLFYDGLFSDTRAKWIEANGAALPNADGNWRRLSGEEPRLGGKPQGPAPDFALRDENGEFVRLSDFKGQVVVLVFWARWSEPSLRGVEKLLPKLQDRTLRVLAIDTFERELQVDAVGTPPTSSGFCTVLLDGDDVARRYGVESVPTFFVIGADGTVVAESSGLRADFEAQLITAVDSALAKASAPPAPAR